MGATFSSKMVNQFTNPDGTPVEPVMTKQKSNGTKEMEYRSTDGVLHMTRQIDNKGTQVLQFPDGSKETWYTQGGSSIMIRSEVDGSKVQTNADGSTITSYPDGNKVQRMSNGIFITEHPDHSTLMVASALPTTTASQSNRVQTAPKCRPTMTAHGSSSRATKPRHRARQQRVVTFCWL